MTNTTFNVEEALERLTIPQKIKLLAGLVRILTRHLFPVQRLMLIVGVVAYRTCP